MSPTRNKAIWLIIFLFILKTMVVFLSELDHSGDGWGYACEILKHNFLSGHHLLYNITGYFWLQLFNWLPVSPIKILTWMNVVFSSGTLYVTYKIIQKVNKSNLMIIGILLFLASCFGFFRYSLENETYILPLFFGVVSIYYLNNSKKSYYSWIAASIACLYHQIYIFWLIPILFFQIYETKNIRYLIYSLGLILTPYLIASHIYNTNIYSIVFQDVNNGIVNNYFNIKNFLIGCINLVRTVTEVHGRIGILMFRLPIYSILGISLFLGLLFVTFGSLKNINFNYLNKIKNILYYPESYILISTILFSFYCNGNAEFMVSIPFLIVFIAIKQLNLSTNNKFYLYIYLFSFINLTWNTIFYLIPNCNTQITLNTQDKVRLIISVIRRDEHIEFNKLVSYSNNNEEVCTVLSNLSQPKHQTYVADTIVFISSEAASLYNCLDYNRLCENQIKIKEILFIYPGDSINIKKYRNRLIYTDLKSDNIINRAYLTEHNNYSRNQFIILDSIKSKTTVYRISTIQ